jgi:cytochrome c-type biogenesis protein
MSNTLIYSSSIVTAFFGGILALFAPCCIVSLGPTYLAGVVAVPRSRLVDRTGVFALGVAVILLPIVLGIGGIGILFNREHALVFFFGGILMLMMGFSALAGKGMTLPIPMIKAPAVTAKSSFGMFCLGLFSGVVSSCCAPVLGGVLVLSATAGSVLHALSLGVAYVVGMVVPLFLAALLWDRFHLAGRGVFKGRMVSVRLAGTTYRRRIPDLGAALLFLGMGGLMIGLAITGRGTYSPAFLRALSLWGDEHLAQLAQSISVLPQWVFGIALIAVIGGLVALAWPRDGAGSEDQTGPRDADEVDNRPGWEQPIEAKEYELSPARH